MQLEMNKMNSSARPKEIYIIISCLASFTGVHAIALQRAGHLVFGRMYDSQAVGFGIAALCMGIYSLWLYLSAVSQQLKSIKEKVIIYISLYIISILVSYVIAYLGMSHTAVRIAILLLLLISAHVLHRQIIRFYEKPEPETEKNMEQKK